VLGGHGDEDVNGMIVTEKIALRRREQWNESYDKKKTGGKKRKYKRSKADSRDRESTTDEKISAQERQKRNWIEMVDIRLDLSVCLHSYYDGIVFQCEISSAQSLGKGNSQCVAYGGRYDYLVSKHSGSTFAPGGVGFSLRLDPIIELRVQFNSPNRNQKSIVREDHFIKRGSVYVANVTGDPMLVSAVKTLVGSLWREGITAEFCYEASMSLEAQRTQAELLCCEWFVSLAACNSNDNTEDEVRFHVRNLFDVTGSRYRGEYSCTLKKLATEFKDRILGKA